MAEDAKREIGVPKAAGGVAAAADADFGTCVDEEQASLHGPPRRWRTLTQPRARERNLRGAHRVSGRDYREEPMSYVLPRRSFLAGSRLVGGHGLAAARAEN